MASNKKLGGDAPDRKSHINPAKKPLTRRWNPIATGLILSAGNLVAVLAAVSNLTAQIIVIFTQ